MVFESREMIDGACQLHSSPSRIEVEKGGGVRPALSIANRHYR